MVDYSADIRWRILLIHYIFPLVLYTMVIVFFSFDEAVTNVIFGALLVGAFVLNLTVPRRKYLYSFDPLSGGLEISYYTVLLKRKVVQVPADLLSGIGSIQTDPFTQCPTLRIKVGDRWHKYTILSKGLKDAARLFFSSANAGIL